MISRIVLDWILSLSFVCVLVISRIVLDGIVSVLSVCVCVISRTVMDGLCFLVMGVRVLS